MTLTRRPWKSKPPLVTVRGSTIDPALRQLVRDRAGGCCELCGTPLGVVWECHHRKLRSQGGQDSAANLVALCPGGRGCHKRVHGHRAWAEDQGWIVRSYEDPRDVPVAVHETEFRFLTIEGRYLIREATA